MQSRIALSVTLLVGIFTVPAIFAQQRNYPPELPGAKVEAYKTVGDVSLNMYIFEPRGHQASDQRPAIVFFFGGGWRSGSPGQFAPHCQQLAELGMVAMTADYRVASRHKTLAKECVSDAKSAVRWVRQNAERLGVDPQRIVAAGGSAGGHIAACTGVIDGFEDPEEDHAISSRPNALALFNPAVVLAPVERRKQLAPQQLASLQERLGVAPQQLSPFHHVRVGQPPTIIFHGEGDTTVPFSTAEAFTEAMHAAGNRCELKGYEGQPHGFFNHGRSGNRYYNATFSELESFLRSLGYIEPSTPSTSTE